MMILNLSKAILLSSVLALARAGDDDVVHFEVPDEIDVPIPPLKCMTNADGFGGDITGDFFNVEFHYEVEYLKSGSSVEDIVTSIEKDTTDFILQSSLFDLPCSTSSISQQRNGGRRMIEAVGISANPEDFTLEGVECSDIDAEDESTGCVVVSSAFQVYYSEGGEDNEDELKEKFEEVVEDGIDKEQIKYSNRDVVQVITVAAPGAKEQTINPGNKNTVQSGPEADGNNTGIIVGATVGALLAIGAVALYRRRQANANNDETVFTPEPSAGQEV